MIPTNTASSAQHTHMTDNANLYHRLAAGFKPTAHALELPDGTGYTFADVERHSARAANVLSNLGLSTGDRVSVIAEKSLPYLWLYLGCLRAGFVFHPLNPGYTQTELAFFLANAGTRALLYDASGATQALPAADDCPGIVHRLSLDSHGGDDFCTRMLSAPEEFATVEMAGQDSAALLYSSGTTGTPKGIRITHENLYSNAQALREAWEFSADDILVHALPVFHVHGLFITLGPALLAGTTLRWLPRFNAAEVIAAMPGATMMAGVPTYYSRLLASDAFDADVCASIRVFISGSAPLSEAVFHAFEQRTGHRILERYGMTETGILTSNPLHGERKPSSVGPVLPGVGIRVVDDAGIALSGDVIGAVQVRGDNVFPGYWELPAATDKAFSDGGWFDTGDQGYLDDDQYLFIAGRSKDMVISGGLNVYPKEIERDIERMEGVAEAAVFGVPHADFGEAVVAAVVATAGKSVDEGATIAALKTTLAAFKVPKRILLLDDLPRNTMGKVQKNKLRERYDDLFSAAV